MTSRGRAPSPPAARPPGAVPGYTGGYRVRRCCDLPTCAGHYWIEAGHYFVETYEDATEAQARADDLTKSGLYPSQV